jgi:ABC-type bacteriocin/lantibiotic exporter with double-glycine peptidase domain
MGRRGTHASGEQLIRHRPRTGLLPCAVLYAADENAVPHFKQRDLTDCGAACFAYVCHHYRLRLPIARLRQELGTNQQGTTAAGLVQAARRLGFTAKGVKGPVTALPTVPLPAIAHCNLESGLQHYVVLVQWSKRGARVMDPAVGRIEQWPQARFTAAWTGVLLLLAPGETFQPGDRTTSAWRRWWLLLQPHRTMLGEAFAGAVATTILGLAMSVYVQKIVDQVIPDGNRPLLQFLGVAMFTVLAFRLVLGWCQSLLSLRTAQRIDAALILGYYQHLLRLPQPFFDTMRVGEITSRVGDAVKVRNFLNNSLVAFLLNPLILLFSLAAMFLWSWKLALLSAALLPLNAGIYWAVDRMNRTYQRQLMERSADFDSQLVESLSVQPVLRRFGLEEAAALRTEVRLVRLLRVAWRTALGGMGAGTVATLVAQGYLIGLLWLGADLVLDTGLTPGQLMSSYTLAGYLTGSVSALIGLNASIQEALIATDRLFELLDLELEVDQGSIEFTTRHAGNIRFEGVGFGHVGRPPVLHELSLTFPTERITALAGESGSGKSTVLALLQRLYLPTTGRILVGEHDLRYFRLASLRRHLAVVPQQTQLLAGTVLENLAPGDPQPDFERLLGHCREAEALGFIERLPQGFLTQLSENGTNLSGGQRQRLALVRALYREAPILLLDEPSSALDPEAEQVLIRLLRRLRAHGCTIVVAAHSPAVLAMADRVVVLVAGSAVEVREHQPG